MKLRRLVVIIFVLMVFCGCQAKSSEPQFVRYRQTRLVLGTVVSLDICAKSESKEAVEEAYQKAWAKVEDINVRMDVYNDGSESSKIAEAYLKPMTLSDDLYELLSRSIEYSRLTEGAFDIVNLSLLNMWKGAQSKNVFPSEEHVREVKASCGSDKLTLLGNKQVVLTHPKAMIHLGGIAKGFAIDAVARIFKEHGFENFYIDAGGDLFVSGHNCDNKPWRLGIRHPRFKSKILEVLDVSNMAVTTSGDYERFFYIEDQKWSHILNPITGYPQKRVVSATVIAPNATMADALSTALCVLTPERGLRVIDSLEENVAALIVEQNPKGKLIIHKSRGYDALLQTQH